MVHVYYDPDVSLDALKGRTVAVIGYGSQGRAQALNMRDSGVDVIVGLRRGGPSWRAAEVEGFSVYPVSEAAKKGDIVHILIPDQVQPAVYRSEIKSSLSGPKVLGFSHGFNIHFKQIVPPSESDVIMVAPKSPGRRLRETFLAGFGVPALIAVEQDRSGKAKQTALAMSKALGCTRAGVLETTFRDETESDLIGEQTVLVGGLIELIKKGFETLVEAGYAPELAYFEACNEAKLIMDLIYERGLVGMLRAVSDTAKYGGLTVGPRVIDEHVKANMTKVVEDVQNGRFAEEWVSKFQSSSTVLDRFMNDLNQHQIEIVGRKIRRMAGLEK
jgi:ketol-acid reductoisomerase